MVSPRTNPSGSDKRPSFFGGRKPLKHTREAGGFFGEVQEGKIFWETEGSVTGEERRLWRGNPRSVGS
jgi:hypothetical protein